ncbi:MAG: pyridoxamine 5'-phosphate oxidase [Bacteroidota bacterium]
MGKKANKTISIAHFRKEYTLAGLKEDELELNPFDQFRKWFTEAIDAKIPEPTAMTLATATKTGKPSARIVLLKKIDERGFVFFSNYKSRKGRELSANPNAAVVFHWVGLERQVRIIGTVTKVLKAESEEYFRTRPIGSRLAAWASNQSDIIKSREVLEKRVDELVIEFRKGEIPLPRNWGGYRVTPSEFEFWQGRPNRLHDRFRYLLEEKKTWKLDRLSP